MVDSPTVCGRRAEVLAANYLIAHGLVVLERNLSSRWGELDLVCTHGQVLVMVEVRKRKNRAFGGALASISAHKRRRLLRAARFALLRHPEWRARRMRFDVVGFEGPGDGEISWVQDAFRAH